MLTPLEPHSRFGEILLRIKLRVSPKRESGPKGVESLNLSSIPRTFSFHSEWRPRLEQGYGRGITFRDFLSSRSEPLRRPSDYPISLQISALLPFWFRDMHRCESFRPAAPRKTHRAQFRERYRATRPSGRNAVVKMRVATPLRWHRSVLLPTGVGPRLVTPRRARHPRLEGSREHL